MPVTLGGGIGAAGGGGSAGSRLGWINVQDHGAAGDGVTDDTAAIQAAITAAGSSGVIYFPAGVYLFSSSLTTGGARITLLGDGGLSSLAGTNRPATVLLKAATLNAPGIVLDTTGAGVDFLAVEGVAGNGDDGIQMLANSTWLRNVSVSKMGGVGVNVGDNGAIDTNSWMIDGLETTYNGSHGLYVASSVPDVNVGIAKGVRALWNTGDGINVGKSVASLFSAPLCEHNTLAGMRLTNEANYHVITGGDWELNTVAQLVVEAGATRNYLLGVADAQLSDSGTETNVYGVYGVKGGRFYASTGADLLLGANNLPNLWKLTTFGHLQPEFGDNLFDLGGASSRIRSGYFGTSLVTQGGVTGTNLTATAATAPVISGITNEGTPGGTTYTYKAAAYFPDGSSTEAGATVSTATGNAALDGTNFNRITITAVTGASSYKVERTVGGASQGIIGTLTAPTVVLDDTGLAGVGNLPTSNTTGIFTGKFASLGVPYSLPAADGVAGQALKTNADGTTSWGSAGVTNSAGANVVTKSDGTNLVASSITETAEVLGADLVTNGTFTGGTAGWTVGAGWAYGTDNVAHSSDGTAVLSQSIVVTANTWYKVKVTISNWTVGTLTISWGATTLSTVTGDGTHIFYLFPRNTAVTTLSLTPSNTARYTVDDVMAQAVTTNGGDSTRLPLIGQYVRLNAPGDTGNATGSKDVVLLPAGATVQIRDGTFADTVFLYVNNVTAATLIGQTSTQGGNVTMGTGYVKGSSSKSLTDNSATIFATVAVASGSTWGGKVLFKLESKDGTDFAVLEGDVHIAAINQAGTITATVGTPTVTTSLTTGGKTQTLNGFTVADAGSNVLNVLCNYTSDIADSANWPKLYFRLDSVDTATWTPV